MVTTRAQSQTPSRSTRSRKTKAAADSSVESSPAPPTPTPAPKKSAAKRSSMLSPSSPSKGRSPSKLTKQQLAPKTTHTEFGGAFGAFFVSTSVPFFTYFLYFACSDKLGCAADLTLKSPQALWTYLSSGVVDSFLDLPAYAIYFGWYAFTVLAWLVVPGPWVQGSELRIGGRLDYKINAFRTLVLSFAITAGIIYYKGPQGFTFLYDHFPGLIAASLVNSLVQAFYCYFVSFSQGKLLALGGNTGNHLFDWFIGRELNPRIGTFDIKTFNELRPGLILWALIDISCACHQYVSLRGRITDSMVLVCAFQLWYVIDALYNESAIFTQMDITTDGFGFMLSVGDLTWVPFTYGLQARYLAFHPVDLGVAGTSAVLAVNLIGYYIFRDANGEKDNFRNGTNPKNLSYMVTSSGRKLLTSGWWGRSRHPNYMGDWIMAWAWCLPTGFNTPITYFYVVFFAILLVHRQLRDDEACQKKYGKDWDKYCKLVPSRIIPGIY